MFDIGESFKYTKYRVSWNVFIMGDAQGFF